MSVINSDGVRPQRWRSRAANRAGMPFPDVLRQLREAHGMSQSELARRTDTDHSWVSRMEMGSRNPGVETLIVLADEFDLHGEARFQFFASAGKFEQIPTEDQLQLMALISQMDGDGLRAIRAVLAWEIGRKNQHTYAANDGHLWYSQDTPIERPGGACNTPDPATEGMSSRAQQV